MTDIPEKTLIWWVPECAGGICDRVLGLVSTYCIAEELGRRFLIKWDYTDISAVLKINPKHNYYTYNLPYVQDIQTNIGYMDYLRDTKIEETWKNKPHVLVWSNLNIFNYFCKSRPTIPYEERFLNACKIVFKKFLIPISEVEQNITHTLQNVIGIHIRTHDNQFEINNVQNRKKQIPYIQDVLKRCKAVIEKKKQGKTIFIASDCMLAVQLAKIEFGSSYTILSNNGPIVHSGTETVDREGMIRVIADLLSLSRCKLLYLGWHTNYSRFAALLNPEREFFTYEHPNNKKAVIHPDLVELMSYFSQTDRWDRKY